MNRLELVSRRSGIAVGSQVFRVEGLGVRQVGIQCQEQGRTFLHDSHPGMTVAVNPTLVSLRLAKPTLQIQVVTRQVRLITADEQARLETRHHRRHLPTDRVRLGSQAIPQRGEVRVTLNARAVGRIESGGNFDDLLDLLSDRDLRFLDRVQPSIDEPGQATQERFAAPPFFASRIRPRDCLTSSNASAIRRPGGCIGPPWSSLRMPRIAEQ
jgi:hypothetical protein